MREEFVSDCGCVVPTIIYLALGALSAQYNLWAFFGKNIPWYWDIVLGMFAFFDVPAAIVVWILVNIAEIPTPFFVV